MRERDADRDLFRPLRPARGLRLWLAAVLGPICWIVALVVAAWMLERSDLIEAGLLITLAVFALAVPALLVLHRAREREERRCARQGAGE